MTSKTYYEYARIMQILKNYIIKQNNHTRIMVGTKNIYKELHMNIHTPSRQWKLIYIVRYHNNNKAHQVNNYIRICTITLQEAETPQLMVENINDDK